MTVELLGAVSHYVGLAADEKPTTGVRIGSTFFETDTSAHYVYSAAGWTLRPGAGGQYNLTKPTLTDGDHGDLQLTNRGALLVGFLDVNGNTIGQYFDSTAADGVSNGSGIGYVGARQFLFNGSGWDRLRGNAAATGLASAARTASTATSDQTNYNGRGAQIILDVTATPNNAETLQVTVELKDPVSGKYVQVAAFTALTASVLGATPTTETYVYTLYPGAAETIATAKHELQALPIGRTWRVNILHSASGSWTYSVGVVNLQ
ncbi:MAG: hypothetical protein AB7I38_10995 [Dehalococcoidia bacterium]